MQTDVVDIALWRDILWILMCGFMVALMQAGFTCLESGFVRSKNSINVAIKNLIDFCISIAIYTVFGFGIMWCKLLRTYRHIAFFAFGRYVYGNIYIFLLSGDVLRNRDNDSFRSCRGKDAL